MKPILNRLYVWDGSKAFEKLAVKTHPSGYRYAMNVKADGFTKTLILITAKKQAEKKIISYFNTSVEKIKDNEGALKAFKDGTGDTPVLLEVPPYSE